MRHGKLGKKLGRKSANRKALMMNLASSLILNKKIKTTDAKAKELRRFIEPLITFAKKGDLHSRRQVLKKSQKRKLFASCLKKLVPCLRTVMEDILG